GAGKQTANPDVAIVGAGVAGLAAAHALIAGGRSVLVLEALPRIGGRAYTDVSSIGVPWDRGAAYLEGGQENPLLAVARRFGFGLSPYRPAEWLY
ncbi:MAG TPA: hypothetical protein DCL54_15005, partial [Alphaproteobacteria bacterium]|nr:hypothetical protein [Alphaproteobacteria bacterium]